MRHRARRVGSVLCDRGNLTRYIGDRRVAALLAMTAFVNPEPAAPLSFRARLGEESCFTDIGVTLLQAQHPH